MKQDFFTSSYSLYLPLYTIPVLIGNFIHNRNVNVITHALKSPVNQTRKMVIKHVKVGMLLH